MGQANIFLTTPIPWFFSGHPSPELPPDGVKSDFFPSPKPKFPAESPRLPPRS